MELSYKEVNAEEEKRLNSLFPRQNCFIEVLPGNVIVPKAFKDIGQEIRDMTVYPDDVWMVSFPRTGSTWAQEMVWLLGNNLDFEGAKQLQQLRAPLLELSALFSEDNKDLVKQLTE